MRMRLRAVLRNLFHRDRVDQDLDAELRSYCDLLASEKVAAGMSPDDARRLARVELGGVEQVKETVRAVRAGALVEQLLQDLRYGLRMLHRNPVFTSIAVLTLALGIGANTAIFTVVNAVLLRPLPFGAPEALFVVDGLSYTGEFLELQKRAQTFDVTACETRQAIVTGGGEPLRIAAAPVAANFMALLQVEPALGRTLRDGDERARDGAVAVISHAFWQMHFGRDPAVLGRLITIDGQPRAIVGVMPDSFGYPSPGTQIWTASPIDPSDRIALWSTSRRIVGRVRGSHTLQDADTEVKALGPTMAPLVP